MQGLFSNSPNDQGFLANIRRIADGLTGQKQKVMRPSAQEADNCIETQIAEGWLVKSVTPILGMSGGGCTVTRSVLVVFEWAKAR